MAAEPRIATSHTCHAQLCKSFISCREEKRDSLLIETLGFPGQTGPIPRTHVPHPGKYLSLRLPITRLADPSVSSILIQNLSSRMLRTGLTRADLRVIFQSPGGDPCQTRAIPRHRRRLRKLVRPRLSGTERQHLSS